MALADVQLRQNPLIVHCAADGILARYLLTWFGWPV
jgi:hypothetical protein